MAHVGRGGCLLDAALPYRGHDGSRHWAISNMNVEVCCCRQLIFVWERHDGWISMCAVSGELIGMQCGVTTTSLVFPASIGMYLTLCMCVPNCHYCAEIHADL